MTVSEEAGGVRCENGGECLDGIGESFTCLCPPGWTGAQCEVDIDECQAEPCLNEGHCIDMLGDFYCVCPLTWTGRQCEEEVAQCQSSPCLNDALCLLEAEFSTLIGRSATRLCSHWLIWIMAVLTPALLCHKDTLGAFLAFHIVFMT